MSSANPNEMLTPVEAASLLRCRKDYVWRLCRDGKLKHMRKGQKILIKRAHVSDYIDAQIAGGE
jgi:excisionase family DNA binding protein